MVTRLLATMENPEFRASEKHFTRGGPLSPQLLITIILYMVGDAGRRGYRHLLDAFWDEAETLGLPLPQSEPVSSAAFCKARHKIPSDLIQALLGQVAEDFEAEFAHESHWHGRRVFAVDGCKVNLQRSEDLDEAFGRPTGGFCPQAMVSTLFNVISKVPYGLTVAPYASCERTELYKLCKHLRPDDVLVLDRGYPSYDVVTALFDIEVDFLIRMPTANTFAALQEFIDSDALDRRIVLEPPAGALLRDVSAREVRAIKVARPDGELRVFITSLRRAQFTRAQIEELYHLRWEVEEFYKLTKSDYLGPGQFHSKSLHGVEQEIHATALFVGIARFLMAVAARAEGEDYDKLSPKAGILGLAAYLTRLLLADPDVAIPALGRMAARIVRTKDPRRRGRSCMRRSFKPRLRWGPKGKIGGG